MSTKFLNTDPIWIRIHNTGCKLMFEIRYLLYTSKKNILHFFYYLILLSFLIAQSNSVAIHNHHDLQVDVDECQDTAAAHGVSAMPTFIFFRQEMVVGAEGWGGNSSAGEN